MNADGDALEARHFSSVSSCSDCSCTATRRYVCSIMCETKGVELRKRVGEVVSGREKRLMNQSQKVANVNLIRPWSPGRVAIEPEFENF